MISDTARYHGSFFIRLFEQFDSPISVQRTPGYGVGFYLIEGKVPVYLKHSTKRRGPWAFNFFRSHQESQERLYLDHGECFTCLICGKDGVIGLNIKELRRVLDAKFEEQEAITVTRRLNSMYKIKGRNGALERRMSRDAIYKKIQDAMAIGNNQ